MYPSELTTFCDGRRTSIQVRDIKASAFKQSVLRSSLSTPVKTNAVSTYERAANHKIMFSYAIMTAKRYGLLYINGERRNMSLVSDPTIGNPFCRRVLFFWWSKITNCVSLFSYST